ncbi:hypothetical protein AB0L13_47225, partial [Saccharopolyspora shandongensis]
MLREVDGGPAREGHLALAAEQALPAATAYPGRGPRPVPRYRVPTASLAGPATAEGCRAFRQVTWRHGSQGPMRSRFRAITIRPASRA